MTESDSGCASRDSSLSEQVDLSKTLINLIAFVNYLLRFGTIYSPDRLGQLNSWPLTSTSILTEITPPALLQNLPEPVPLWWSSFYFTIQSTSTCCVA